MCVYNNVKDAFVVLFFFFLNPYISCTCVCVCVYTVCINALMRCNNCIFSHFVPKIIKKSLQPVKNKYKKAFAFY